MMYLARVKATNEEIVVYSLSRGTFYDYDNMGASKPPSATKAGKKEFEKDELVLIKEVEEN